MNDVVATVRGLRRAPGFSLTAIGMLSAAMAANSVMFSVINAVARPELPYRDASRVLSISEAFQPYGWTDVPTSLATYDDLRQSSSYRDVAVHSQRRVSYADGQAAPTRLQAAVVSSNLWRTLGVAPAIGRDFSAEDDRPGGAQPILIGHRVWRERYGQNPSVLNTPVVVDGVPRRIAGVMPEGFRFPETEDMWLPLGTALDSATPRREPRDVRAWRVVARLNPGATIESVRVDLASLSSRLADEHPPTNRGWTLSAVPIARESLVATGTFFGALQAGAFLLLLLMCGNLGNLLLARGEQRRRELAIRSTLGASRPRLVAFVLYEGMILSIVAAGIALLVASWCVRLLPAAMPESIPFYIRFRIDPAVVAVTTLLALAIAAAAGAGSALRVPTRDPARVIASGASTLVSATGTGRLRSTFLFLQTALAAALLASTFLVASVFRHFNQVDLGFDPRNTLLVELPLPAGTFSSAEAIGAMASQLLNRVATLPGVRAAAISAPQSIAVAGPPGDRLTVEVAGTAPADVPVESYLSVTSDYFAASGMHLLRGRGFTPVDRDGAEPVVVLNAEAARRLFGDADPLGQRVRFGRTGDLRFWRTVVGTVANTIVQPMDPEVEPRLYVPFAQDPGRALTIVLRSAGDPEPLARSVSQALNEAAPSLAHETPITAERRLYVALWPLRFFNGFAGGLAAFGILVAGMGVYGLTRYLTLARTREIGLRLALGARSPAIVRLIAMRSGVPVAAGLGAGLAASLAISNLLRHVIAGVPAFDPLALSLAACCLVAAAVLSIGIPAWRATRIEPVAALKNQGQ
jgi:putative ABC transport system permease protein